MLIIDRFEGEYAVCEDADTQKQLRLPKVFLPRGVREGDCLCPCGQGEYQVDAQETLRRRALIKQRLDDLYRQ